jgi:hypothetical protein
MVTSEWMPAPTTVTRPPTPTRSPTATRSTRTTMLAPLTMMRVLTKPTRAPMVRTPRMRTTRTRVAGRCRSSRRWAIHRGCRCTRSPSPPPTRPGRTRPGTDRNRGGASSPQCARDQLAAALDEEDEEDELLDDAAVAADPELPAEPLVEALLSLLLSVFDSDFVSVLALPFCDEPERESDRESVR